MRAGKLSNELITIKFCSRAGSRPSLGAKEDEQVSSLIKGNFRMAVHAMV